MKRRIALLRYAIAQAIAPVPISPVQLAPLADGLWRGDDLRIYRIVDNHARLVRERPSGDEAIA
jgi:hypothetical protein